MGRAGAYYGTDAAATTRRLESLGVSGVVQGDHLFLPGPPADDPTARMAAECLTVLTTIAAHSTQLGVATLVANVGFQHPLPLLRRFANLALLHGGDRVYAGLGAGWSRREFEALGLAMPPHRERLARLAETAELARTLFDRGGLRTAARACRRWTCRSLPRRWIPRACCWAAARGRFSNWRDASRTTSTSRRRRTARRRASSSDPFTTIDDLAESARAARAAGRPLTTSLLLTTVVLCDQHDVRSEEEAICARVGLPWRALDECPYVLVGEPARIAEQVRERQERIGLDWLIVPNSSIESFASDVMPRLG